MWTILWFLMVIVVFCLWAAPEYWGRKVYPHITVAMESLDVFVDIGDPVTIRCKFSNPTRLPCPRVKLSMKLPEQIRSGREEDGRDHVEVHFYLMPRQIAEVTFTVYAVRRGIAQWQEADLEFTDALGLRKEYRTVYVHARAVVRPRRLQPVALPRTLTELLGEIRTKRFYHEDPSLFVGVRPYQAGDPLRGIHWLATARTGELMVKQFGHTTSSKVLILFNGQMFDLYWKTVYKHRLDAMCERLLQISAKLMENETSVGLLTNLHDSMAMSFHEPAASGPVQLARLANRMGSVSEHPRSSMADLIRSASRYAALGDTVLLLTSYWDTEAVRAANEWQRKYKNLIVYNMLWDDNKWNLPGVPAITENIAYSDAVDKEAAS
ncbi:DUF58 domain-containing protein [Cohnella pontilimi]|uniref:DUF58 domain-containing protein n=1 Tax=Cohnella pontilimi TaxID=2564100 RepID=A0A4V5LSS3_9BACL|nr:DUF58 domain-containing protein [Cohnella pontilimi]TJY44099.1 DUF58 domain-containing protein [Cohnella pontilimi]